MNNNQLKFQLARAEKAVGLNTSTPYLGEAITQFEHGIQAAYFAEKQGHSEDVQLASLMHDIGHYYYVTQQPQMGSWGAINHEWIGARLAKEFGFSNKVATLIGYHVDSKRYLAGKSPAYLNKLSEASLTTLRYQGGPMQEQELATFEAIPNFREVLQVRTNDEKGKEIDLAVPPFEYYSNKMLQHLKQSLIVVNPDQVLKNITLVNYTKALTAGLESNQYDLVLYLPLPSLVSAVPQKFQNSLAIKDYFFTAGLDTETLDELKISFTSVSTDKEYIAEFLHLVNISSCHNYLLVVHEKWLDIFADYMTGRAIQDKGDGWVTLCYLPEDDARGL